MSQDRDKQNSPVRFRKMTGDLIGVSVLAVGVAAVIGVGYLAYVRFGGESDQVDEHAAAVSEIVKSEEKKESSQSTCPNCGGEDKAIPPQPLPTKSKLAIPSEVDMAGSWQADFGSSKAFLQISKGAFQLIYVRGESGNMRKYSRGRYVYDADRGILALQPDRSFGEPDPVEGVRYKILTMRHYDVIVFKEKRGNILYWQPGSLANGKARTHPVFLFSDREEAAIKWEKTR